MHIQVLFLFGYDSTFLLEFEPPTSWCAHYFEKPVTFLFYAPGACEMRIYLLPLHVGSPPNGMAQRQRRNWQDSIAIIAHF